LSYNRLQQTAARVKASSFSMYYMAKYIILFLNIHLQPGLEFHSKFVLVDGDLFNQPSDKLFVIFGNVGGAVLLEMCSCLQYVFSVPHGLRFQAAASAFGHEGGESHRQHYHNPRWK